MTEKQDMMNDLFDGEVLGAFVTLLVIVGPMLIIAAYDKHKANKSR